MAEQQYCNTSDATFSLDIPLVGAGENCASGVGAGVASGLKLGRDTSLESFKRKYRLLVLNFLLLLLLLLDLERRLLLPELSDLGRSRRSRNSSLAASVEIVRKTRTNSNSNAATGAPVILRQTVHRDARGAMVQGFFRDILPFNTWDFYWNDNTELR